MKKNILVTGGTGLIGKRLRSLLDPDIYNLRVLTRKRSLAESSEGFYWWDTDKMEMDEDALDDIWAVINLAGAGIADKRWTAERKQIIIESRVNSLKTLEKYLKGGQKKPLLIGASAVGYYGDRGDQVLSEGLPSGNDYLSEVVKAWEAASHSLASLFERVVLLRIGILLSSQGGALEEILKPARFGIYTYFGDGQAWYPWIHIDDLCGIIETALREDGIHGTLNAVNPEPVTIKELAEAVKTVKRTPGMVIGVPAFVLRVLLGEMADMLLNSTRAIPARLNEYGYNFKFNDPAEAIGDLIERNI